MQNNNLKKPNLQSFEASWNGKLNNLEKIVNGVFKSFRANGPSHDFISAFNSMSKKVFDMHCDIGELKYCLKLQKPPPAKYDGEQMELEQ